MAKIHEIKFLDQHLEKIVLGVCALVLVYGVFQWVLSTPRRTEVPKIERKVVPAGDVDRELLAWARRVEKRERADDGFSPVYDYAGEIEKHRSPAGITAIKNWGNYRQVMVPPKRVKPPEGMRLDKIRDILLTLSPEFTEIKGARELINKGGGVDQLVFRGKAKFPLNVLLKAWNKEFRGSAMDEVLATALKVEIEKRLVLSDGTFGPVTRVARVEMAPKEGAPPVLDVVIPEYTGKNADIVRKAILEFSGKTQDRILRPPYWSVWAQNGWIKPWIKAQAPAPAPPGAAPVAAPVAAPGAVGAGTPAPVVPQIGDGTIELWFHDTDVIIQRKYSYRMRIVFVNPLFTYDDVVYKGTPKDALVQSIASEWSKWVQADAIPRTTQFFAIGVQGMGNARQLYCTVFTRSLGQLVSEKFPVSPGHVIGGVKIKKIRNPAAGADAPPIQKVVDFSTNAVVIHVDFSKEFDRMGRWSETRELICLEDGKLVSHILVKDMPADDERSMTFKKLQAELAAQTP